MLPLEFIGLAKKVHQSFPVPSYEKPTQTFWPIPYKVKSPDQYKVFVFYFLVVLHAFFVCLFVFFTVVLTPIRAVDQFASKMDMLAPPRIYHLELCKPIAQSLAGSDCEE